MAHSLLQVLGAADGAVILEDAGEHMNLQRWKLRARFERG
jgi:hypothetical protein